ncbi:hypothetical protein [Nocardia rhizosphaerae]|uniref:DUF3558 domain-containing protein n=1 Tax=Nocardia rhizosphaerae TaxID=1691571 RepID=A0ABV8L7H8_9NOCA
MRISRVVVLAGLAVTVLAPTACQEQPPAAQPAAPAEAAAAVPTYWKTAPASDTARIELLARLRAVDPCALIPRAALAAFGEPLRVENSKPGGCEATFGSTEIEERTSISWSLGAAPQGYTWGAAKRRTVDGITIGTVSDADSANPTESRPPHRTCLAVAAFGNTTTLPVTVNTPLGTEPCPIAEAALARAMTNLAVEPPRGTSPDTPPTALLGKDPCEVAEVLGADAPAIERRVWTCRFTFRGDEVQVQYDYQSEQLVRRGEPIFTVNGHHAYGDDNDGESAFFTAAVGPALPGADPERFLGADIPTVDVFGTDRAVLTEVLRTATGLFPAT